MPGTVPDYLKVTAAIYADGGTCGAADKVKGLLDERRRNLLFTRELANRVENGVSAEQLATWGAAMPSALRGVIDHVIEQLKSESPEKVAGALRDVERIYVASKPAL
jgi:hypothetical protein